MRVPLLDLKLQFRSIESEIRQAIDRLLASQQFILGDAVKDFEENVARYCGVPHAVGCASGSDALLLALLALGVGPGDEVITTPLSFYSTASSVTRLGARPVFADIDPATFNIDPDAAGAAVTPRTKAILPVHLYGQMAEMGGIMATARERGLAVVEDAAQAIGSRYDGAPAGSVGDIGCFSFFPSKNLGAYGDGGLVTTSDERLASRLRTLRLHGEGEKYVHQEVGINSRLDALQAAVLTVKLSHVDGWSEGRRANAARYDRLLAERGLAPEPVRAPHNIESDNARHRHTFHQYTLRAPDRDGLAAHLRRAGIGHAVYYPLPLYLQPCFRDLGYKEGLCPQAEKAAAEVISLPIFPELTGAQQEAVVEAIAEYYQA